MWPAIPHNRVILLAWPSAPLSAPLSSSRTYQEAFWPTDPLTNADTALAAVTPVGLHIKSVG